MGLSLTKTSIQLERKRRTIQKQKSDAKLTFSKDKRNPPGRDRLGSECRRNMVNVMPFQRNSSAIDVPFESKPKDRLFIDSSLGPLRPDAIRD